MWIQLQLKAPAAFPHGVRSCELVRLQLAQLNLPYWTRTVAGIRVLLWCARWMYRAHASRGESAAAGTTVDGRNTNLSSGLMTIGRGGRLNRADAADAEAADVPEAVGAAGLLVHAASSPAIASSAHHLVMAAP